jgi:hypothetical protein
MRYWSVVLLLLVALLVACAGPPPPLLVPAADEPESCVPVLQRLDLRLLEPHWL